MSWKSLTRFSGQGGWAQPWLRVGIWQGLSSSSDSSPSRVCQRSLTEAHIIVVDRWPLRLIRAHGNLQWRQFCEHSCLCAFAINFRTVLTVCFFLSNSFPWPTPAVSRAFGFFFSVFLQYYSATLLTNFSVPCYLQPH